jgi:Methyltransferase domain
MEKANEYILRVESAIGNAIGGTTKLSEQVLSLGGMSVRQNRIFLNEIVKEDTNYLEIGVCGGSTFISANYKNNPASSFAVDNWSQFSGTLDGFKTNCNNNEVVNFEMIETDCFNVSPELKSKVKDINVYFYDGDHREQDQRMALTYWLDNLANVFIYIVDDWNHQPAKDGTRNAYKELEAKLKVHKEWEHPWHNGTYIAVCEKI